MFWNHFVCSFRFSSSTKHYQTNTKHARQVKIPERTGLAENSFTATSHHGRRRFASRLGELYLYSLGLLQCLCEILPTFRLRVWARRARALLLPSRGLPLFALQT